MNADRPDDGCRSGTRAPAVLPRLMLAALLALPVSQATAADAPTAPGSATAGAGGGSASAAQKAPASTGQPAANTNASAAANPAPGSSASPPGGMLAGEAGSGLMRSLLGLAIVLSLIGGLAWLARKFGSRVGGGKANVLKTVGALAVGQRENVVVVELGGQWLVLGVAPGRVNALAQMPRQELPQAEMQAGAKAFAQLLARARGEDRS